METTALVTFLADIGTVLTAGTGWVGTLIGTVMENPVLLVPCAMAIAGSAIGLYHSLRH